VVSLLSASGVTLEEVADVTGHSTTRMTGDVYRHAVCPRSEPPALRWTNCSEPRTKPPTNRASQKRPGRPRSPWHPVGMPDSPVPGSWTVRHFSQGNPKGEGQADVPALLRRVASTIESLGAIEVHDITFSTEITEDGSWHHLTVYFDFDQQRVEGPNPIDGSPGGPRLVR
jgi:hypothetical protein